ncbi:Branched-chain amino acid ABC transporter ATP-binding protein/permease [Hyphomicrobiales bacterium]|nr:Branched-chain amino acid ABC transporter ATP-binding protein/permease [Hyphomicrobiales bacterium]CAH1691870.1 Branched-chain amino acid ABC transporter ATP-binding protein/permease [Hyphomicrobiales bacterium]
MKLYRYIVLAAVIAVFPLLAPNPFFVQLSQDLLCFAIAAIGLNLLIGLSGQLSLGHAGFFAIGAYTSAVLATAYGYPLWLSVPIGVVAATVIGAGMSLVALRTRTHYLAMATLAFGFIIEIIVQRWVGVTGGAMGITGVPRLGSGEHAQMQFVWIVGAAYVCAQAINDYVMASHWGRGLHAVKESESFGLTVGVNVPVWRAMTFIVSATLAGLSGAFFVHQSGYVGSDGFGLDRSIAFLIMVVVGGLGMPYAGVLGAMTLVLLNQLTADLYEVSQFIFGAIFLFTMLVAPGGASALLGAALSPFKRKKPASPTQGGRELPSVQKAPEVGEGKPLLQLVGLSKSYAGVKAVDDVSFSVMPHSVHAIIGPNGAGKSTLINTVSGLYLPTSGEVAFLGRDVTRMPPHLRARLGLARTFQNLQLIGTLTAVENVMLGLGLRTGFIAGLMDWLSADRIESAQRERAVALMSFFGIAHLADKLPGDLPYGHRKLLEMARALAQNPSLMLLDEPIAGLNEEEAEAVARIILKLKALGMAILIVEHNMPFVMSISDTVTVIDYGRKIAEGPPAEIQKNPAVIQAYLGAAATPKEYSHA